MKFAQSVQWIESMCSWNSPLFVWWYLCKLLAVTVAPIIITGRNRHLQWCLKKSGQLFSGGVYLWIDYMAPKVTCWRLPAEIKWVSHTNIWKHLVIHSKYSYNGRKGNVFFFHIALAVHLKCLIYPVLKIRALFF